MKTAGGVAGNDLCKPVGAAAPAVLVLHNDTTDGQAGRHSNGLSVDGDQGRAGNGGARCKIAADKTKDKFASKVQIRWDDEEEEEDEEGHVNDDNDDTAFVRCPSVRDLRFQKREAYFVSLVVATHDNHCATQAHGTHDLYPATLPHQSCLPLPAFRLITYSRTHAHTHTHIRIGAHRIGCR